MSTRIEIPREALAGVCGRWKITEFALFGSVLREDFGPDSDIDVLVTFSADAAYSLFDLVRMQDELSALFGRDVDLVERVSIESSRNYLRRKEIFENAEVVYAA